MSESPYLFDYRYKEEDSYLAGNRHLLCWNFLDEMHRDNVCRFATPEKISEAVNRMGKVIEGWEKFVEKHGSSFEK